MKRQMSGRGFLRSAATGAAAFTIVPRRVLGGPKRTPPSEELNIACIGVGGKGAGDVGALSGENIVALCDVDEVHAAETFKRFPKVRKYRDFRKMLDEMDKQVDAVTVSTPDHIHYPAAMMAVQMGKHVYCQKPLTHSNLAQSAITESGLKPARAAKRPLPISTIPVH